jgi:hypothetical protein
VTVTQRSGPSTSASVALAQRSWSSVRCLVRVCCEGEVRYTIGEGNDKAEAVGRLVCGAVAGSLGGGRDGRPECPAALPERGNVAFGKLRQLTITGNAFVADGASLTVAGNLTLAPGACLDAFSLGTVTVGRNVSVRNGATLALGCSPGALGPPIPQPPCGFVTTNDTVGGNIIADQPLTMYLTAVSIRGNVVSTGGGPGPTFDPYINFPIKENTIGGNLIVQGWQGAWFGALRNAVSGNVIVNHNVGVAIGDLGTLDSTEVVANTIGGNLICQDNSPMAQIGDAQPVLNTVAGHKIGQCAGL